MARRERYAISGVDDARIGCAVRVAGRGGKADMDKYADVLSFGGGVNSVALAIMAINDGWRGEIVFADTGCEWPETMCYIDYFEREWLSERGFGIARIRQSKYKNGLSLIEYCEHANMIPLCAVRWCTQEYKVNPLKIYAGERQTMIGIAADEAHRQPNAIRPLVDTVITRQGCIKIIQAEGLDVPQKSGCYICPFQRNNQWRMLWERHPDLFERAARLEENARRHARQNGHRTINAVLDPSGKVTLRQRELSYKSQMMLPEIDMDELLQYKPCLCTV